MMRMRMRKTMIRMTTTMRMITEMEEDQWIESMSVHRRSRLSRMNLDRLVRELRSTTNSIKKEKRMKRMKRKNNSITLKMKMTMTMKTVKTMMMMMMIYSTMTMMTMTAILKQLYHPPLKPFSACFTIRSTQQQAQTQRLLLNVLE